MVLKSVLWLVGIERAKSLSFMSNSRFSLGLKTMLGGTADSSLSADSDKSGSVADSPLDIGFNGQYVEIICFTTVK